MLFSSIAEDSSIDEDIKHQILNLQIPVIKASTDDPSFFNKNDHPIRKTLSILAKLGTDRKNTREISLSISRILDALVESQDVITNDFISVNHSLLKLFNTYQYLIDNFIHSEMNEYKKTQAKKAIIYLMQNIITNKKIPAPAHELCLKLWPSLLSYRFLIYGENSLQWNEAKQVYEHIINSLQPISNDQDYKYLVNYYPELVGTASSLLNDTDINKERIRNSINSLNKAFENIIKQYQSNHSVIDETSDKVESIDKYTQAELKLSKLPSNVKVGTWFDLYTTESGPANRLKLSLIVKDSARLIFVDHRGVKGMEKDAEQFSEELARRLSRPVKEKSSFVDTWNDFISRIANFK